MDPATIIGTTSAILSFVQFTGKVISVAYKIHDSADGAIDENRSLEEAVTEVQNRLEKLQPNGQVSSTNAQLGTAASTNADTGLLRTAHECEMLGNEILRLLNKTKAKYSQADREPLSLRRAWKRFRKDTADDLTRTSSKPTFIEGIRAGIQTVWQKDNIDSLRRQWEGCVVRLNIDLQRLDSEKKHDVICAAFQETSEQVSNIRELVQSLMQQSQTSKLECLQSFLDDFREVDTLSRLEQRNIEWILRALEFEGMNARREQVESTVGDTFEWFITDDAIPDGHPDLKISFKKWLSDGTGVYHVTGKPGSGKSTLMKLIDQAAATREQLENWASRTGERLITARFYTWKAANANPLQNQEEGMSRTLLHQILTAAPELARVVFSKHHCWNPQEYRLINLLSRSQVISTWIHFEHKEILATLESLFRVQGYRFFFLIDGMDEFEKPHNHRAIAERVLRWSSHNLGRVKICASSREENAFMDKFGADQRLRLHIVTADDVHKLVTARLMEHDYFAQAPAEYRQKLIKRIAYGAEGVFLWVVLTIQELRPLMDDHRNFQMLLQEVDRFPEEIGEFLREILSRIPARYKEESEAVFSVVTSNFAKSHVLVLFHYSMLRKCLEIDDPDVDNNHREMSLDEAVSQIQEFRSRLPSLCKGLLETAPVDILGTSYDGISDEDKNATIQCTHRSIFDFLRSSFKPASAAVDSEFTTEARGEILAIRSVIEVIKATAWDKTNMTTKAINAFDLKKVLFHTQCLRFLHPHFGNSIFPSLRTLDASLLRKQGDIAATTPFNSTTLEDIRPGLETVSVLSMAFQDDFCEYIDWALKNYPPWILTQEAKSFVVGSYYHLITRLKGGCRLPVRCLTENGWLSINEPVSASWGVSPRPSFFPRQQGSIWVDTLLYLILFNDDPDGGLYFNFGKALSAGAEPRIRFKWWSQEESPNPSQGSTREADLVRMKPRSSDEMASERSWAPYDRDMPFGSQFGMTIEVGDSHEPERIQGPQWPGEENTRLIRFCVTRFGKPSGSATLKEVVEAVLTDRDQYTYSDVDDRGPHYEVAWTDQRRSLKAIDDALARVGTLSTIETQSGARTSGDTTEDSQHPDTREITNSDQEGLQQAFIPPDGKPSRLRWLGPRTHFHDGQTVIIFSLAILLAVFTTLLVPQSWWKYHRRC